MSVEALAAVLHHSRAKGTAKVVAIGIANHDGDGGAWPSVNTLAIYANVDRSTVKRAIKSLVALGEVRVHLQAGGTAHMEDHDRPNLYEVLVDCPEGCDRTRAHKPRRGWKRDRHGTYVLVEPDADLPLWKTGGGAGAPGGVSAPTPGALAHPEPSTNHHPPREVPQLQDTREDPHASSKHTPPCMECSAANLYECARRQSHLLPSDRHHYDPRPTR